MKYVFVMAFAFGIVSSHATELRVKKMTLEQGMDHKYDLETSVLERVVLDCQSFVQGLTIGENLYLLEPEECESVEERMQSSFQKFQHHCFEIDDSLKGDYSC